MHCAKVGADDTVFCTHKPTLTPFLGSLKKTTPPAGKPEGAVRRGVWR